MPNYKENPAKVWGLAQIISTNESVDRRSITIDTSKIGANAENDIAGLRVQQLISLLIRHFGMPKKTENGALRWQKR